MTAQLISTPYHVPNGGGPARWHLGALLSFKATASDTGGRLWAKELLAERGMATPVHRHSREDEAFYVLEGEISVHVGDDVVRARQGGFLWAPRDVRHAFCVESARARVLVVSTPAGFEQFFFNTGQPATELTVPPADAAPSDPNSLISALASYGVEVLGPPPSPITGC